MTSAKMKTKNDPRWVTIHDKYGDPSTELAGSKEGLIHLRDTIDRAVIEGEATTDQEISFFFERVKVMSSPPKLEKEGIRGRIEKYALFTVLVGILGLLGLGLLKFVELLAR